MEHGPWTMMKFDSIFRYALIVSPQSIPRFWTFVNVTLFLYSTALLIILAFRDEGDWAYDVCADEWYLTYDVVTCLVWLIETSLTMVWLVVTVPPSSHDSAPSSPTTNGASAVPPIDTSSSSSSTGWKSSIWWFLKWHIVEWILAFYFLIDSTIRVVKTVHGVDHTADMVFDVGLNFLAYGYILIAQYIERRRYYGQRLLEGYEYPRDAGIFQSTYQDSLDHYKTVNSPSSYMVSA